MGTWNGIDLDELVLHSGRLTLRPWQPSDVAPVEQIMTDRRMGRYLPLPWPYTRTDATDFVNENALAGRRDGNRLDCAVAENSTGRLIGSASLILPHGGRPGAEIGYWLGSEFWGNGYMTEAVQALTRFGFDNGVARIRIICEVANLASARVALRAGYRYESIARAEARSRDGAVDAAVFARLPSDPGEPIPPAWPELTELSDGVVSLRPIEPDDWPVVLAEMTNAESVAWGFGGPPIREAIARWRCEGSGLSWLTGGPADLLICDAATGEGAGAISLRPAGPPRVAGIGYGVLPQFRGRRFTTRALRLISAWAFEQAGLARLELGCKAANLASARAAEAAGFAAEGTSASRLRNPDGSYSDELRYSLVRPSD